MDSGFCHLWRCTFLFVVGQELSAAFARGFVSSAGLERYEGPGQVQFRCSGESMPLAWA